MRGTLHGENVEIKEVPYPKLMRLKNSPKVVLFSSPGVGVVVVQSISHHPVGYFGRNWDMSKFIDLPEHQT